MALTLIIALILGPVAATDNCVSSASWTKRDEPRKDCAWVGRLPEKRCDVRGAAPAGSDAAYLLARDACPAECDPSCAPEWGGRPRAPPGPFSASLEDGCFANPTVCLLNETCVQCAAGDTKGCCRVPRPLYEVPNGEDLTFLLPDAPGGQVADCFATPGICSENTWCQIDTHESWDPDKSSTRGRCVPYQHLGEACQATQAACPGFPDVAGLNEAAFHWPHTCDYGASRPAGTDVGEQMSRATRCAPGLQCTGNLVPTLPGVCVLERPLEPGAAPPSGDDVRDYARRWIRMGGKNRWAPGPHGAGFDADPAWRDVTAATPQIPRGTSRESVHQGVNELLKALWNEDVFGAFREVSFEETTDLACCPPKAYVGTSYDTYSDQLSAFQKARGGPAFRNPLFPNDAEYGNPPPCVWCAFDGAYVDENPNIWYLIHALTFNLPETLAPDQVGVLSALPLFLRMHQSCDLCRSHLHEHLVELDIPGDSRRAEDWARFFWRAHNFVNEQTQVTRCGSQECGWGSWTTPAAAHEPVGVYRNPWFMTYANAEKRWKHADE